MAGGAAPGQHPAGREHGREPGVELRTHVRRSHSVRMFARVTARNPVRKRSTSLAAGGPVRGSPLIVFAVAMAAQVGLARADRLADPRLVARGDYLAPQFSPDGTELLV